MQWTVFIKVFRPVGVKMNQTWHGKEKSSGENALPMEWRWLKIINSLWNYYWQDERPGVWRFIFKKNPQFKKHRPLYQKLLLLLIKETPEGCHAGRNKKMELSFLDKASQSSIRDLSRRQRGSLFCLSGDVLWSTQEEQDVIKIRLTSPALRALPLNVFERSERVVI